jgi:hypothetical protein
VIKCDERTHTQTVTKALEILMDKGLTRCLCHSEDADKLYFNLLASTLCRARASMLRYPAPIFYPDFFVAAQELANYRMLLAEHQLPVPQRMLEGPKEQTPYYQWQRQRKVELLRRSTEKQRRDQIKAIGPDLLDSLASLGDGMAFLVRFDQIGSGTFRIMFEVTDTVTRSAQRRPGRSSMKHVRSTI